MKLVTRKDVTIEFELIKNGAFPTYQLTVGNVAYRLVDWEVDRLQLALGAAYIAWKNSKFTITDGPVSVSLTERTPDSGEWVLSFSVRNKTAVKLAVPNHSVDLTTEEIKALDMLLYQVDR